MKIAVLSSHTSSLFWFRMDMMKAFIENGHSVIAVGPDSEKEWKEKFNEYRIEYKQVFVERNGTNPLKDIRTYLELSKFMKEIKPDKVFAYQAKTVIYGSLAAKMNGNKEVYSLIAGLGSIFRGSGLKNELLKSIMRFEYWMVGKVSKKVFFQNHDDRNEFIKNKLINQNKTVIINGSGVNLEKFQPTILPDIPTFLFIGRLIKDKGIMEYLEACKKIKEKYPEARCLLVGPYDTNPSAIKEVDLEPYLKSGIIEYFGEQNDVRPYISQCSTYVLPSYHEGTPKTVLEAIAMGRPIITSDAPGCRETVVEGENGYLIPVKDVSALTGKMEHLLLNPEIGESMGKKSLEMAKEKYDVNKVNQSIMETMGLLEEKEESEYEFI